MSNHLVRSSAPDSELGVAMVEAAFILLAAGIVIVGIIFWLVPATNRQYQVTQGREAVGLATTLGLSVGKLGQGGQVVDTTISEANAVTLAKSLTENSGLAARAQAIQTDSSGSPGAACAVTLTFVGNCMTNTGAGCAGTFGDATDSPFVLDKVKAAAAAECLPKDFFIASEYEDLQLRKTKGLQAVRKAGFQPDYFTASYGSGFGS
ncbi:MAG: hypothetical protein J0M12_16430 [Deltaproteobacteria bacterium]|nr:hypothetical protein [Deltaproteobacteria bacterium]